MSRVLPTPQQFTKYEELPKNAVKLTSEEVEKMQMERVAEWPSKYEVWPFRFGVHIVSGTTAGTAYAIDNMMRRVFVLGSYQPLLTLLPTLIVPCVCHIVANKWLVMGPVIQGKATCKTCYTIRGASVQVALSTAYPLLISALSCYGLARQYHTLGGRFSRNQMELFKILKMPKQGKTMLAGLFLGNYLLGGLLAYKQMDCLENVLMKKRVEMDLEGFE